MNRPKLFLISVSIFLFSTQGYLLFSSEKGVHNAAIESLTGVVFSGDPVTSPEIAPAHDELSAASPTATHQKTESATEPQMPGNTSTPTSDSESKTQDQEADAANTETQTEKEPSLMSLDDFIEILKSHEDWQWTAKLSSRGTSAEREAVFQQYTGEQSGLLSFELIPFLLVDDPHLSIYLSKIFATKQQQDAIDTIILRRSLEKESWVKDELLKSLFIFLPGSVSDTALNDIFAAEWVPDKNHTYFNHLHGRLSDDNQTLLKEALQSPDVGQAFNHESVLLLSSCGMQSSRFSEQAFDMIMSDNVQHKVTGLKILRFQEDKNYYEKLVAEKRNMYHTDLLEEYLKTMVILSGLFQEAASVLNTWEESANKHHDVIAWACRQAAKRNIQNYVDWIVAMGKKYDLGDHPVFKMALTDCGIDLDEWQSSSTETIAKKSGPASFAWLILPSIGKDATLSLNGRPLDISQPELKIPSGSHTLKYTQGKHDYELKVDAKANHDYHVSVNIIEAGQEFVNATGMKFKVLPPGVYTKGNAALNIPLKEIQFSAPLMVGMHEVTNKDLETIDPGYKDKRDRRSSQDNQPAINLNWFEAVAFCNQLSIREKLRPVYDEFYNINPLSEGYRLLTESEWEYAALAGKKADELKPDELFFGNNTHKANYSPSPNNADGHMFTAPVGSFAPNAFGLFDMIGNVNEWCHDYYSENYYTRTAHVLVDPLGPDSGKERLIKGGSWQTRSDKLNPALREYIHPNLRSNTRGFRVCRKFNPLSLSLREEKHPEEETSI